MKKLVMVKMLLCLALFFISSAIQAQNQASTIKSNLTSLFDYSKSKAFEKASLLISYEGEDAARSQKDAFNPANKDELNQVKRICKKISALIELSSRYEFGNLNTTQSNGRDIYSMDVSFISGDQKLVTSFSFIETEKGLLLLNLN